MAHPKAVPLLLGGVTRHLLYDFRAICPLRDKGINAMDLKDDQLLDPRVVRDLVWAGLLHESPDVTQTEVESWIDFSNLVEVGKAITDGFVKSSKRELDDPQ